MKKILSLIVILILTQSNLIAQNENDRALILKQTNIKLLDSISKKANEHYINFLKETVKKGVNMEVSNSRNIKGYLSGFDINGNPIYDFDDNVNVAITSRVDRIWNGGSSGLNLNGDGIQIGHWEAGGLALTTHQEFNGRVTHAEFELVTSHATHTACTLIGTGVDNDARGMASSATIVSRRSNNDESEIANFGAAGGILSNHSYSTGNPNGDIPVYGVYTNNSKEWDEILYNAPYLTLCKSAGNDRNDGENTVDNGYDLIYTVSTSKNLITVGAVNDVSAYSGPQSITQSAFSNWGPTDDWRIKPDIIANGVSVYSADDDSDTDYTTKSGTSMSTPSVTGAIALLQQHYHNENGVYMKAATVKALLLGTTDEAGANDGPDFQNGWGLLNAERAAEVISNNGSTSRINELSLSNGTTYTTTFEVDGTLPLALTIVWTDPSGNPLIFATTDDQTPMLINDLDVRITKNATVYSPWVMTPNNSTNNFTDAATKGDNFRDNVERIDVSNLTSGIYTVTVTHKGNLINGSQDFSMVINGLLDSSLGIEDYQKSISIYPNPAKKSFRVYSKTPVESITIYDIVGNRLITYKENEEQLYVGNLVSGIYLVSIKQKNNSVNVIKRLIVD
ncbi:peptidase S8 and S53, subtilisin, kexin, sedolisin [Flavobacteriales bacterium ALC-1]|nr:peptidase S8 and S53, subtilisin, kexin, sedolisin [Flavobacteriales bacterium ALC-1]